MTTALAAGCLGSGVGSWCRGLHGHAKSGDPSLNQGNPRTSIAATWFSHVCQLSSTRKPTTAEPWQSSPTEKAASRTGYPSNSFEAPMPRCERSPSRNPARKPPGPPPPAEEVLQWIGSRRLSGQVQPWLGRTDGSEGSTLAFEGRIEGLLWLHEAQSFQNEARRAASLCDLGARRCTHARELLKLVFRAWRPMR